jgi:heme o synthase
MATLIEPSRVTTMRMALPRTRLADYFELTKPRIAMMALVTVAAGYLLAANAQTFRLDHFLHTLFGAGLVAAGGSALNHWLERRADSQMRRTANRPLPAGRMTPLDVIVFGLSLTLAGIVYLALALPTPAAAIAAGLTAFLYVAVYTPLKRITTWNTVVGAIPGALPPIIGWCAARGGLTADGCSLFAILFVWQLPHFYSIAWMHREDYARGGMIMLPVIDKTEGRLTGWVTVLTCALLVLVTALPFVFGSAGWLYLIAAMPLALWFQIRCIRFAQNRTNQTARTVLRGSLVYLLGVMAMLVIDGILPRYLSW